MKPSICLLTAVLFAALPLRAEKILLVAGGAKDAVGIPATEARLKEPFGVDFDRAGNLFIIEMAQGNRLLKVDAAGSLTHVAGSGKAGPPSSMARTTSPCCPMGTSSSATRGPAACARWM